MSSSLKCQNCNSALRIDKSLSHLSSAQRNLLVGKVESENHECEYNAADYIPPSRLKLYNEMMNKRALFESLSDESDNENEDSVENTSENRTNQENSSHLLDSTSFVFLSQDHENEDDGDEEFNQHGHEQESVEGRHRGEHINGDKKNKSKQTGPKSISQRIATLSNIFRILSSNQDIDHPLCFECSSLIIENYKLKFDQNQKEKESYVNFLKKLKSQENAYSVSEIDEKLGDTVNEYQELKKIENEKLNELRALEQSKQDLDTELRELEREYDALATNEIHSVLQLKNQTDLELSTKQNKLDKSKASYQNYLDHLDQLRNLNIYTEMFSITFDAQFGTINGYRIGYKVPWPENNAALGQIVLLLMFLLKRFNIKLDNYKLVPMGSQSHIIKTNEVQHPHPQGASTDAGVTRTVLALYTSNDFSLGKLFNYNKLDVPMVALLEIVLQIETKMMRIDPELVLPYSISIGKESIGGKSVRVSANAEWTTSCKFLLTNLNWLLLHASVH